MKSLPQLVLAPKALTVGYRNFPHRRMFLVGALGPLRRSRPPPPRLPSLLHPLRTLQRSLAVSPFLRHPPPSAENSPDSVQGNDTSNTCHRFLLPCSAPGLLGRLICSHGEFRSSPSRIFPKTPLPTEFLFPVEFHTEQFIVRDACARASLPSLP